ncbi:response regulator transcription factor [Caproiciproducens faecalis]|uniref:Stage 0 sporulation protein A homolog n=1 Tax=Caproiciproducens faecalis TaxID=2820301 RepID=A0ABS7DKQ1_9FIRM|nr:response regulator transcription factor [Caproiciproducens faecalis]MBW7571873.1 response regulator transcription factor [Caproiciproducens faecalis]
MKLMLVDDHPLFIEGLSYLLETYGFEVSGIANSGKEALEKARILKPDVVLMDIKMPDLNGIDTLKLLKAEWPEMKIAMLTSSEEDEDLFDAIKYGASGYLLKSTGAKELAELLHGLENGEAFLTPAVAERILQNLKRLNTGEKEGARQPAEPDIEESHLTERQLEILEMVAKGVTYKDTGTAFGLTERTVKYHMGRIIELLHLENRSQVIAYAVKMGIVQKPHI